jgi:hypothetical protein
MRMSGSGIPYPFAWQISSGASAIICRRLFDLGLLDDLQLRFIKCLVFRQFTLLVDLRLDAKSRTALKVVVLGNGNPSETANLIPY